MNIGYGTVPKHYWLPMVVLLLSGCAAPADSPGQRVNGIYTYEVEPRTQQPMAAYTENRADPVVETEQEDNVAGTTAEPDATSKQVEQSAPDSKPVKASTVTQGKVQASPIGGPADSSDLDIQPGQCWVYAQIQARPMQDSVTVKVRDSEKKIEVTPTEFRRGFKQVVTKEGTETYRLVPAAYKQVTESVEVKPETTKLVVEPAVYEDIQKEVVLEEARTDLQPCRTSGAAAYGNASAAFGFCAVEIPAKTETVSVTELVKPETTRTETVPAEYEEVTRWVVETPAEVIPVKTDDEVDTFEISELVSPAGSSERDIPAETISMNVKRYEGKAQVVARQAVCDRDLTSDMVLVLQEELAGLGYNPGERDGLLGPQTITALSNYQIENGLASGAITVESAQRLGIID